MDQYVYSKKILGSQIDNDNKNLYLCCWYHMANHGVEMVWAFDEVDAKSRMVYGQNDVVTWVITKVSPASMPVVFEGASLKGQFQSLSSSF